MRSFLGGFGKPCRAVGLGIVLINIAVTLGLAAKESDDADQESTEPAAS
jgi:hypothetical protein